LRRFALIFDTMRFEESDVRLANLAWPKFDRQRREICTPNTEFRYKRVKQREQELHDILMKHIGHGQNLQAAVRQFDHPIAGNAFQREIIVFGPIALHWIKKSDIPSWFASAFSSRRFFLLALQRR